MRMFRQTICFFDRTGLDKLKNAMSLRSCARLSYVFSQWAKNGCHKYSSLNARSRCLASACHSTLRSAQGIMASCDTFVALPSVTKGGCVVFGKNSDRPSWEVQEVVYCPPADYQPNATVQCTYISIPQASHTAAVVLSKPAWMWGAEMGSNEHGVCIGNEAIYTKLLGENGDQEQLLGMDLVRLGLERGRTAREALDVITALLEAHGQGGPCCDDINFSFYTYHNSFLIADHHEAWVLETADREWAAELVTGGVRNISNLLTIHTKIDAMSKGLKQAAEDRGFWKPSDGEFDFAKVFSAPLPDTVEASKHSPEERFSCGQKLLALAAKAGNVDATAMFNILREKTLCMMGEPLEESIPLPLATMGSQVSIIHPPSSNKPGVHWFTATPNPRRSVFKPFFFVPSITSAALSLTTAPTFGEGDPAKREPRFETMVDRRHALFRAHETIEPLSKSEDNEALTTLHQLEAGCVADVEAFLNNFNANRLTELTDLFKDVVESEMKFYSKTSHKL